MDITTRIIHQFESENHKSEDLHIETEFRPFARLFAQVTDLVLFGFTLIYGLIYFCNLVEISFVHHTLFYPITILLVVCFYPFYEARNLARTGQTIGKEIFGLVVYGQDEYLTYKEALERTWRKMICGMGVFILPSLSIFLIAMSYLRYDDYKINSWDEQMHSDVYTIIKTAVAKAQQSEMNYTVQRSEISKRA